MFDISVIEVDNSKENIILKKSINLDVDLDCFIMISCSSSILTENLINNALEHIIDKISKEETYNDFWIALENINSFLKTWNFDLPEEEREYDLDMSIAILNDNNLMFSNIWKATVYLINRNSEVIELTERNENKKNFLFISSWNLANSEIIVSSTLNILKYLSKSDIIDWMVLSNDIEIFNKNIKNILQSEIVDKNCIISSMKYINEVSEPENEKIAKMKEIAVKALETDFSRKVITKAVYLKQKVWEQSKATKNLIFFLIIIGLISLLYFTISWIAWNLTKTEVKQATKSQIEEIREYLSDATKNIWNPGLFNRNIEKAEVAIKEVEAKNLYINDIARIREELNILKKQFNKIEIFNSGADNLIFAEESDSNVKIVKDKTKTYIVGKKTVLWPIIWNSKPKKYVFNDLGEKEEFVDWWIIWQDLYLVTNNSKVVKFNRNGAFSFVNISWNQAWENIISSGYYNSSIYTLSNDSQIRKHPAIASGFAKWNTVLKEEDTKNLWPLLAMAIDWGFYLLKKDLSMVKFYSAPYRLESLSLNKLPENYNLEEGKRVELKAWADLNYVYMYLNEKIFVFKLNTKDWRSTRDLTYVWQIEWNTEKIIDFSVNSDWELTVLNSKGLFKLRFEVSEDKLTVR